MRKAAFILIFLLLLSTFHMTLIILPINVMATTHFVGGGGPGNYTSIQGAIDAANPGDTVFVYNGTYYESPRIDRPISLIGENRNTTIIDNKGWANVVHIYADWVNITGFTVTTTGHGEVGISLYSVRNCHATNNNVSGNEYGIRLHSSSNNIIANNTVSSNRMGGIYLDHSDNNTVSNNTAWDNRYGIKLGWSNNNKVTSNIVFSNREDGIILHTTGSFVSNNTISNNLDFGMRLYFSRNTTLRNNVMARDGIFLHGDLPEEWNTHTIDTSNSVNGRPVYYWKNAVGGTIPSDAGQVILANCTDVVVENLDVSNASLGIRLGFSSNNTVSNNKASNNEHGIMLWESNGNLIAANTALSNDNYGIHMSYSRNNVVVDNTASLNRWGGIQLLISNYTIVSNNTVSDNSDGISLDRSSHATITGNTASDNWNGILLKSSSNTTIANNTVSDNYRGISLLGSNENTIASNTAMTNYGGVELHSSNFNEISNNMASENKYDGIYLLGSHENVIVNNTAIGNLNGTRLSLSSDNMIYHNNLIGNINQSFDDGTNLWDNGYPSGGNYWSDYSGVDEKSGPNQDQSGSDGIGDSPYDILGGLNEDRYPLMSPYVPPPLPPVSQLPVCNVTNPIDSNPVSGTLTITGTAFDYDGTVYKVEIRIDDRPWVQVKGTTSWEFDWDTTALSNGVHTIHARSFDGTDYSSEVSVTLVVENAPPQEPGDFWLWLAVGMIISVCVVILLVLHIVRRRMKQKEEQPVEFPEDEFES